MPISISMPDLDGLELQRELATTTGSHRPLVFVTGKADIPTSVRAMKAGAIDFLTKPVKDEHLFDAISRAQEKDAQLRKAHSELESIRGKVATLTPREREVFALVVAGRMGRRARLWLRRCWNALSEVQCSEQRRNAANAERLYAHVR